MPGAGTAKQHGSARAAGSACGARPSAPPPAASFAVRRLGLVPYDLAYGRMREFTAARAAETPDELWLLEHSPVYTLGQAGRVEHLRRENGIPVVRTDRGGQVTYHGPGQLVAYVLLDLRRRGLTVKRLVWILEQAVIDLLAAHRIAAERRAGAPGVYVAGAKVAALGLRVRAGCTYHGLALNVDMDLAPFRDIDPCGYEGLAVTQLAELGVRLSLAQSAEAFAAALGERLASRSGVPDDGRREA